MEEALKDAMVHAADFLTEALRAGLMARGFDADLSVQAADYRVTITSRSRAVWTAEIGQAGSAPTAPLSGSARAAGVDVAGALHGYLKEALR